MHATPVSVLVVDDVAAFRRTMSRVVAVCEQFELVGEAASGEDAIAFVACGPVARVLMGVRMPGIGGIAAAGQLRRNTPQVMVVLLSIPPADALPAHDALFCHKEQFGPD